jgi:hypothetical protein
LEILEAEIIAAWKEEYFLLMNYRLDISAKEMERWTVLMNSFGSVGQPASIVNDLFS